MKTTSLTLSIAAYIFILLSCSKATIEDPHNHSLLNKSLDKIRAEIAGSWQMKRIHTEYCGIIAPCVNKDTFYLNNDGDIISFLAYDTVKQVGRNGYPVKIYEKASVYKEKVTYGGYNGFPTNIDSVYKFDMSNGYYQWVMWNIKNDSLVIFSGANTYYLLRKQ